MGKKIQSRCLAIGFGAAVILLLVTTNGLFLGLYIQEKNKVVTEPPTSQPTTFQPTTGPTSAGPMTRLPQVVYPIAYDLRFTTYLTSNAANISTALLNTFQGSAVITLGCIQQTSSITLHAKYLNLQSQTLILTSDGSNVNITNVTVDSATSTVTFHLSAAVCVKNDQQYRMTIDYAGVLQNNLYGYYMSNYTEKGQTE